jgi:3-oxoacyl-[acyl-carrier-protein] synthase-1
MGGGSVCEAEGLLGIRDDGDGVARAIELALADAGIAAADVGMIVAHGNGTRLSDCSEAAAFRRVFGSTVPPVTAFKWAFGHLIAAAGTLDAVLALEALRRGVVPGLATLEALDPACAPLPVARATVPARGNIALVVNRGFAAADAALVVRAG